MRQLNLVDADLQTGCRFEVFSSNEMETLVKAGCTSLGAGVLLVGDAARSYQIP